MYGVLTILFTCLSFSMQDITQNLHDLEQDSSTKAIIVTSGLDRLFCAGLDLTEMYQPSSMERMQDFRRAHQDLFLKIYGCKKTTFAAIAGPAPAAGCMIALCCDYRVLQEASTRGVASMIVSESTKVEVHQIVYHTPYHTTMNYSLKSIHPLT